MSSRSLRVLPEFYLCLLFFLISRIWWLPLLLFFLKICNEIEVSLLSMPFNKAGSGLFKTFLKCSSHLVACSHSFIMILPLVFFTGWFVLPHNSLVILCKVFRPPLRAPFSVLFTNWSMAFRFSFLVCFITCLSSYYCFKFRSLFRADLVLNTLFLSVIPSDDCVLQFTIFLQDLITLIPPEPFGCLRDSLWIVS